MTEEVRRYDPAREYFTEEQCFINELENTERQQALSIARARVTPGVTTRWHRLSGITERYVILEGTGTVEAGGLKQAVGPCDVVVIPPGCRQRIRNDGDSDLVFLAICTPRFTTEAYQELPPSRA